MNAPVAAVTAPGESDLWTRNVWGEVESRMLDALADLGNSAQGSDPTLAEVGKVLLHVDGVRRQLEPFGNGDGPAFTSPVAYPKSDDPFPERLAGLAAMLAAGLPLKCVALTAPGDYDTHDNQVPAFEAGLALTAASLLAFQRDLEARGLADRVLTVVWSEFGRRGEENGSHGTDHGAAGLGFLMGTRVSGTLIGEFPGVAGGLDDEGNLRATADFRALYASILEQWLATDATAIIPGAARFGRPTILKPLGPGL